MVALDAREVAVGVAMAEELRVEGRLGEGIVEQRGGDRVRLADISRRMDKIFAL